MGCMSYFFILPTWFFSARTMTKRFSHSCSLMSYARAPSNIRRMNVAAMIYMRYLLKPHVPDATDDAIEDDNECICFISAE
jgi:hypothetical protein